MAATDTAFQIAYRQEWVKLFEQRQSILRDTTTTEATVKGYQAVFLVAGSGGAGVADATTRGINGRIIPRVDANTQNTCQLAEWHDLVRKTGFNIFASQGNQKAIMQESTMAVLNRKIDALIIAELNNGSVTIGAASTIINLSYIMNAKTKLGNASVPWDSNITALLQPAELAYLMQTPEWASSLYVGDQLRPFGENNANWRDRPAVYRWMNMLVIEHPGLTGRGGTSEKNFFYHKAAIGHAFDTAGLQTAVGYDQEQDYSYARASSYMGAKLLQNAGVVVATFDGSAYA